MHLVVSFSCLVRRIETTANVHGQVKVKQSSSLVWTRKSADCRESVALERERLPRKSADQRGLVSRELWCVYGYYLAS